jgi:hypothetical protein
MTFNQPTWDEIRNSLGSYDDSYIVDVSRLTCYIDDLYDKITDLESRLNRQEEYQHYLFLCERARGLGRYYCLDHQCHPLSLPID